MSNATYDPRADVITGDLKTGGPRHSLRANAILNSKFKTAAIC